MTPEQWEQIRDAYDKWLPVIMEASKKGQRVDPYFLDWNAFFTPIEVDAWHSIRCYGVPLYPQVPVWNYFIDFANPYRKIGLEIDGKRWHDVDRDTRRDKALAKDGWKIFRVTGSEAWKVVTAATDLEVQDMEDEDFREALDEWLNTGDGIIKAIDEVYFRNNAERFDCAYLRALDHHRLALFELQDDVDDDNDFEEVPS